MTALSFTCSNGRAGTKSVLCALTAITMKNATAFAFLAGYLYAISREGDGAAGETGGGQVPQQGRG